MNQRPSFGHIVKERRKALGLTQTELAGRVGCAPVTLRKIEYNALRPSTQMAEQLALALQIPEAEQLVFVRLARQERNPSPIPPLPPAPEEIGRKDLSGRSIKGFELGERIGEGGYGAVYRAVQATVERDVAIKIILPKYANQPEFIRRFEAEAQLVARLEHPHIVPLYDYWREPGVAYLVMRFLRGGSLDTRLKQGPLERYPDILHMLADLRQAMKPESTIADSTDNRPDSITPPHIAAMIELPDLENPYKGLRAFGEADANDFFGRNTLIQALLVRLAEESDLSRFLAVVGPSGSGKSSVVKAGLMPALRQGGLPGSDNWFLVEMTPGTYPLEELETALLRVAVNPPVSLLAQLREDERGLLRAVHRILPAGEDVELVLIIDQFEEMFTLVTGEDVRHHFLDSLVTAVLDPRSRLRVVITLRADFTDRPLQYVDFGELVRQQTEFVLPLTPDELEQAITGPTRRAGLALEPGLVSTIIDDIGNQPGMLPLLQYALTELFERREGRKLTLAAYQASGGVLGALARRAEELYTHLDEAGQAAARQLFLRLVTLGEGTEDTRRRVLRAELEALTGPAMADEREVMNGNANGQPAAVSSQQSTVMGQVMDRFGRYRLLTFDHDPVTREPTVEVAHEALLREWRRLREWLNASRTDVRLQRLLAVAATEWTQANRDPGFLLRGGRLNQFEGWATSTELALTYDERNFLKTSLANRRARQAEEKTRQKRELETAQKLAATEKQAARRFRWLAAGLALFLAAAIGAAWFALTQRNTAQNNFTTAERIRLAAQAQIALDNGEGGDLPARLALRSLQLGYSPEADAALLTALSRGFTQQQYRGHTDRVRNVTFSADGRYVLTASDDNTARLWEAQTGQERVQFVGHTGLVNAAIFSPDARTVLTGSADGTARLWDPQTGRELRQFTGHAGGLTGSAFSPNGQTMVTGDFDRTARLWDVQTGLELRRFVGHTDNVFDGAFSPDGRYILTGSADKTARLWDVTTSHEVRQFIGHGGGVGPVAFSPDGRHVLTGSFDRTARLWAVGDETEPQTLRIISSAKEAGGYTPA